MDSSPRLGALGGALGATQVPAASCMRPEMTPPAQGRLICRCRSPSISPPASTPPSREFSMILPPLLCVWGRILSLQSILSTRPKVSETSYAGQTKSRLGGVIYFRSLQVAWTLFSLSICLSNSAMRSCHQVSKFLSPWLPLLSLTVFTHCYPFSTGSMGPVRLGFDPYMS